MNVTLTEVRDSDFKNAFVGIFNFTVGNLIKQLHWRRYPEDISKAWDKWVILADIFDYFLAFPRPQSSFDILNFNYLRNKRIWLNVKVRWSRESTQILNFW